MKVKNKKGSGAFGVHQQSTNSRYGQDDKQFYQTTTSGENGFGNNPHMQYMQESSFQTSLQSTDRQSARQQQQSQMQTLDMQLRQTAGGQKLAELMRDNNNRRKLVQSQDCRIKNLLVNEQTSAEKLAEEKRRAKILQEFNLQKQQDEIARQELKFHQIEIQRQRYQETQQRRLQNVVSLEVSQQALTLAKQLNKEEMRREKEELKQLQFINQTNTFERQKAMAAYIRQNVQKQQDRDKMRFRMQALSNRASYNDNSVMQENHASKVDELVTHMNQTQTKVVNRIRQNSGEMKRIHMEMKTDKKKQMLGYLSKRNQEMRLPARVAWNPHYHNFNAYTPKTSLSGKQWMQNNNLSPRGTTTGFEFTPRQSLRQHWRHPEQFEPETSMNVASTSEDYMGDALLKRTVDETQQISNKNMEDTTIV